MSTPIVAFFNNKGGVGRSELYRDAETLPQLDGNGTGGWQTDLPP